MKDERIIKNTTLDRYELVSFRCPLCKDRPPKIGEFRGFPSSNFEVGFWCRKCKKCILVSWEDRGNNDFMTKWRVRL